MRINIIFLLMFLLLLNSCKKEVDPKAYIKDPSVQFIQEQISAQQEKIKVASKRVEDSHTEVKKANETLDNLTTKRIRLFTNINLLETENQKLLWLEYRLISLKKSAQQKYLLAELSGKNTENPNQWIDSKYKELLADSMQRKLK